MQRIIYNKLINPLLAVIAVILILLTLFWGDNIGLSNQGDYTRIMRSSSLDFILEHEDFIFLDEFEIKLSYDNFFANISNILFDTDSFKYYPSIHTIIVRISVILNLAINNLVGQEISLYRVSVLGVIYTFFYGASLFILLREIRLKNRICELIAKIIIIVVLCDVGYTAYFNTLYSEPVQIIGLLLTVAFFLRLVSKEHPNAKDAIFFLLSVIIYGWSKFANIPGACLIVIAGGVVYFYKNRTKPVIPAALAVILFLGSVYFSLPENMDLETTFNSVFFGIVKDVDEETGISYLNELGLPPEMIEFGDTTFYTAGVQERLEQSEYYETFNQLSKVDLLIFYLKHPILLLQSIKTALENSSFIRPFYLSNYGHSHPRFTLTNRFSLWSTIRIQIGTGTVYGNLSIALAFALILLILLIKTKNPTYIITSITVLGLLVYNAAIPIISNGEGDLAKHMFAYVQFVDYIILFVLICGINSLYINKYRVNYVSVTAAFMIAVLLIKPTSSCVSQFILSSKTHTEIEEGAYISLGSYDGEDIKWLVTDIKDGTAELISTTNIELRNFDNSNSNYWENCSIRTWLNSEFLDSFSKDEQKILLETDNTYILSLVTKELAKSGDRSFYCFHTPAYAARGLDRAYSSSTIDIVSLPDISMVSKLYKDGYDISGYYWLETPYYSNGNMLRYVADDGYIYMKDATESCGVRPVIYISKNTPVLGKGNISSPLTLY